MPLEMPVEDLQRDLRGCVVMYKNKPVYVTSIGRDGEVVFRDLLSQKEERAPFTLKEFTNPVRRVGFVNVMGSVVYVSRVPHRKYYMGLNPQNIQIKGIAGVDYPQGAAYAKQRILTMCIPEIGEAIMDKYPSLAEAIKHTKKHGGAMAFDKQFAVTKDRAIYFKGELVGTVDLTAKGAQDIKWEQGKEHLQILLDGNYEKTVRDFRPAV